MTGTKFYAHPVTTGDSGEKVGRWRVMVRILPGIVTVSLYLTKFALGGGGGGNRSHKHCIALD